MPASEAQIRANQANAARSTGPKTDEGKARSRENSYKHGLTGGGIVTPVEDAAEIERRRRAFEADFKPITGVGQILIARMALMSVRMDRCANQEGAQISLHIAEVLAAFDEEWPSVDGDDDPDREDMRELMGRQAIFDPSRGATLARRYEAAAERCFFRSLKELQKVEKQARAATAPPEATPIAAKLGSSLPAPIPIPKAAGPAAQPARSTPATPSKSIHPDQILRDDPFPSLPVGFEAPSKAFSEVAFAIGRKP